MKSLALLAFALVFAFFRCFSVNAACTATSESEFSRELQEAKQIRLDSIPAKDESELDDRLDKVFACLEQFTDAKFSRLIVSTLESAEKDIPEKYLAGPLPPSKNPHKIDLDKRFPIGLIAALGKTCSSSKNPKCLPVLWRIIDKDGLPSMSASRVVAAYGDPEQSSRLIERIRAKKAGHVDIAAFGHAAAVRIADVIKSPSISAAERIQLLSSLRYFGRPENLEVFSPLLENNDENVADAAASAICTALEKSPQGATKFLVPMLSHRFTGVRTHAIQTVGNVPWDPSYLPPVKQMLASDAYDANRAEAAMLLAQLHITSARKELEAARSDESEWVRMNAEGALKKLDEGSK